MQAAGCALLNCHLLFCGVPRMCSVEVPPADGSGVQEVKVTGE